MSIYIGKSVADEIRNAIELQFGQTFESINKIDFMEISKKIDSLIWKVETLEESIKKIQILLSNQDAPSNLISSRSNITESSKRTITKKENDLIAGQPVKLLYSGFEGNSFLFKMKIGVGDVDLKQPRANFIIEYVRGGSNAKFYPNLANIQVLAFNTEHNLLPVCEIDLTGEPSIVEPGIVDFSSSDNSFKVVKKCRITL
jgi:hypothetical protein